ncbi:hypothetical protein UUU_22760 [Klebsiella pneumoniae subsp. pneumoniae DSM 30104 = JCM 1662 = NBRC 14940]|nr:hypothetical protein UUU_22760 [Klebsiella pneumoniae subsp. pneumoniae DSM 30104 = JCM 1662 = NBRC 14940]
MIATFTLLSSSGEQALSRATEVAINARLNNFFITKTLLN